MLLNYDICQKNSRKDKPVVWMHGVKVERPFLGHLLLFLGDFSVVIPKTVVSHMTFSKCFSSPRLFLRIYDVSIVKHCFYDYLLRNRYCNEQRVGLCKKKFFAKVLRYRTTPVPMRKYHLIFYLIVTCNCIEFSKWEPDNSSMTSIPMSYDYLRCHFPY